jgi:hypothetical protein
MWTYIWPSNITQGQSENNSVSTIVVVAIFALGGKGGNTNKSRNKLVGLDIFKYARLIFSDIIFFAKINYDYICTGFLGRRLD